MPELTHPDGERAGHPEECPACAELLERQRALTAGLRAAATESRHLGAPARVEARLVAAFRQQAGWSAPYPRGRWWAPALTWAAAAVAMFALGIFLVRDRQPRAENAPAHRSAPAGMEWAAADLSANPDPDTDAASVDGDFIPLPDTVRVGSDEEVNLVRVEVPRSAMIALGFVVSADRAFEPVVADVMLGSDGLARAVRFVNE